MVEEGTKLMEIHSKFSRLSRVINLVQNLRIWIKIVTMTTLPLAIPPQLRCKTQQMGKMTQW